MSIKNRIKTAWKEYPLKSYLYFSLGLNLLTIFIILIFKSHLPPVVPLFYGQAVGQNQLTPLIGLTIPPFVSLLITILNLGLSFITSDDFIKRIYLAGSLLISFLTTIAVMKIVFLIGFF